MDKFLCACGIGFKKKKDAELHTELYGYLKENENIQLGQHKIFKRQWRARLIWWILNLPFLKICRLIGIYIIFMILMKHFNVNFETNESILIGIGIGLII